MEQQPLKTPSPNAGSSPKRVLEDQSDSNPPKRLKSASGSGNEGRSEDGYVRDNDKPTTSTNHYSSPEPQPLSRTGEVLPSIEANHEPNNEGNTPSHNGISDGIIETIERDQFRTPSPHPRPTTSERHAPSTNPTQQSREPSAENGPDNYPLPSSSPSAASSASFASTSPSPSPSPSPAPVPSPSPSVLLAELPYGLLSPTPVSSVTASPTPPASRWVNFSPSPSPRSPFSSCTSISEGGDLNDEEWLMMQPMEDDGMDWLMAQPMEHFEDDDEDWLMGQLVEDAPDDEEDWQIWWNEVMQQADDDDDEEPDDFWAVPQILNDWLVPSLHMGAQEVEANFVDDSDDSVDYDGDDDQDSDDSESTGGQNLFGSRYDSWPDFDHPNAPGGATTDYISDDEDGSEWDVESDPLHEGPRYPGMNAFRLAGYTHHWPELGDQEPAVTYITDDEDEESDGDDDEDDDAEWTIESEAEPEAQWWGAGMKIVHYSPSMWM